MSIDSARDNSDREFFIRKTRNNGGGALNVTNFGTHPKRPAKLHLELIPFEHPINAGPQPRHHFDEYVQIPRREFERRYLLAGLDSILKL